MAPLRGSLPTPPRPEPFSFVAAGIIPGDGDELPPGIEPRELLALKIVSLLGGLTSVFSAILTTYWFVRMRRSFRHDLIMLLIQSDMFKAVWLVLYPLVSFAGGPIHTASPFCQASGFFLALGIEASDVAVLLISLHTALYISRSSQAGAGSGGRDRGLYPHRRYAYAAFVAAPVALASAAFIDKPYGYADLGPYCYLPAEPGWSRWALSWGPRCGIVVVVLLLAACAYVSVRLLIRGFGRAGAMGDGPEGREGDEASGRVPWARRASRGSRTSQTSRGSRRLRGGPRGLLPTLPVETHSLIPPSNASSRRGSELEDGLHKPRVDSVASSSSMGTEVVPPSMPASAATTEESSGVSARSELRWKIPVYGVTSAPRSGPTLSPTSPLNARSAMNIPLPVSPVVAEGLGRNVGSTPSAASALMIPHVMPSHPPSRDLVSTPSAQSLYWRRPLSPASTRATKAASSSPSMLNIMAVLRADPVRAAGAATPPPSPTSVSLSSAALDELSVAQARAKIRRQLRLLFVYPLVYVLVWLAPLVTHLLRWDEPARWGPLGMQVVSMASLALQGAVYAGLFSTRERPWHHVRLDRKVAVWRLKGWWYRGAMGRTEEEMQVEGRRARMRREDEEAEAARRVTGAVPGERARSARQWWDVEIGGPLDEGDGEPGLILHPRR